MNLNKILKELEEHKPTINRNELMSKYIQERLIKSLNTYYSELDDSLEFLKYRNGKRIQKRINKINNND